MRNMLFGIISGVILAFILSFFNVDTWIMANIMPNFLAKFGLIMYYALFAAFGGIVGYFA